MKKNLTVQWTGVICLLAGLAWSGTVAVTPASKTYLQTELTNGVAVSPLPITLGGWGDTNLTVSASGGGTIFTASVEPAGDAPQTTGRTLALTPKGKAGSAAVTVTVSGSGFSPVSTNVSLEVTAVPVLSGLQSTVTFNEDTVFTDDFTVTYWGNSNDLDWTATIVTGSKVLKTADFVGTSLNRSLRLTPDNNKFGEASVRVVVSEHDGTHSATQMVAVTVSPVPNAPVVTGLPSPLSFREDTTTNHVFTVTDLDEGASGPISSTALMTSGPAALLSSVTVSGTTNSVILQLTPYANAYGSATVRVVTANSVLATTNAILVKVQPVADASTVSNWPSAPIELSVGDAPVSQPFSVLTVADADHLAFKNGTSNEFLKASLEASAASLQFSSGGNGSSTTNLVTGLVPSNLTSWVRGLSLYPPESSYAPVGSVSTNMLTLRVYGFGSNDTLSVTSTVPVHLLNPNHPPHYIPSVSPTSLLEGQTITPFFISQVFDQDVVHTAFSLQLYIRAADAALATLSANATLYGNESELYSQLRNVGLAAQSGVLTTPTTNVTVYYVLSDSIDFVTNSVTLTISQVVTAPVINGIDELTAHYSISDIESLHPFPTVITYDTDQGGQQLLSASVSVSDAALGGLTPQAVFSLQAQGDLQDALRQLTFVPTQGALAIGTSAEVTLTLTVTDKTGLSAVNNKTRILITAVNKPPSIKVPPAQPVLLQPGGVLYPFAGTTVTNDDVDNVKLSITLDDNDKGTLGNLGGFSYADGAYSMVGSLGAINASLTNLTYVVNPLHAFPPDDPGGTVFTLEAEDYQVKLGSAQVWVQIQGTPRNHLVTKLADDGMPGSLRFELAHASNNDVITFALPTYPAVIRVPEAYAPLVLSTSLTLKGPGADLLTISGDGDGDGDSDGQLFVVQSRVTIEGVTLSQGHATFGGAVSVAQTGSLTLRSCAVVDCEAEEYGGAIDVEGSLRLEGCYLARNRVAATGFGGGAIAFYTSADSEIVNTTFASNRVENAGGFGGGAIYVERDEVPINVAVTHCTFAGNSDASDKASAVYVVGGNSYATVKNNVFSDFSAQDGARNIDVTGEGWIVSEGGNVCDDSTRTAYQQGGGTSVFLLTHTSDTNSVTPGLGGLTQAKGDTTPSFPLLAGSPALLRAQAVAATTDQRGRIRRTQPKDSGAIQQDAVERVTVTEIQLSDETDDTDQFIEIYVPRDGQTVNLSGYKLFVNNEAVHEFGRGLLALTNTVYTVPGPASNILASYVLSPGRGIVVAFPKGASANLAGFSPLNPTPVVRASIVSTAAGFSELLSPLGRGSVVIAKSATDAPIASYTFLTVFNDPDSEFGTNRLETAHNSIASAPQSRGFAFLPHSTVSYGHNGGMDRPLNTSSLVGVQSPGAWPDGTPFGLNNAFPQAAPDLFTVDEDWPATLDVLGNDYDADGTDLLVVVDVSPDADSAGDDASALSADSAALAVEPGLLHAGTTPVVQGAMVIYDPRASLTLQSLPAGAKRTDTFYYAALDIGTGAITNYAAGTGDVVVRSPEHRLNSGDQIVIDGAATAAYNGTNTVSVVDEDSFTLDGVAFTQNLEPRGVWRMVGGRYPSTRSQVLASVTVLGENDPPAPVADWIGGVMETSIVRVVAQPALAGTPIAYDPDPLFSLMPTILPDNLLGNDDDIDTDDDAETLRLVGVVMAVSGITGFEGVLGVTPVIVQAAGHGLTTGQEILIAGYGGHPSYNRFHSVTVLDDDRFSIPTPFYDNHAVKGVWTVINDANRYQGVTDKGAVVKLDLRGDRNEDNIVFDASVSAFFRTLQEGEQYTNRFYYAVADSHGAVGVTPVHMVVTGINQPPEPKNDPDGLKVLDPLVGESNTLEQVVTQLKILYPQPPSNDETNHVNLHVTDPQDTLVGTLVITNLWSTDERTPIRIDQSRLISNDFDIDTLDVLSVAAVEPFSRELAEVTLAAGVITYDPSVSSNSLKRLARGEWVIDAFHVVMTDSRTGGNVTSLVCVAVVGLNDTPIAMPDYVVTSEDDPYAINPLLYPADDASMHDFEFDINGRVPDNRLLIEPQGGIITPGQALANLMYEQMTYDPTGSELLNQLADWQSFLDTVSYTVNDHSMIFACDDEFRILAGSSNVVLAARANDTDYTGTTGGVWIAEADVTLHGGTVQIVEDGSALVYTPPEGFVGADLFTYTITNRLGIRDTGLVRVVSEVDRVNGDLQATDDRFAVAFGQSVALDVLANDDVLPSTGAGLEIDRIVSTTVPGQPVLENGVITLTASVMMPQMSFVYEVRGSGGASAQARVTVDIVDRRGVLDVMDDVFSVLTDSSDNQFDVLANDNLVTAPTDGLVIQSIPVAPVWGTATISSNRTAILYTPPPSFVGLDRLEYLASDGIGGTGIGVVEVWVGTPVAADDFVTLAATNSVALTNVAVLANDRIMPDMPGPYTILSVTPTNSPIGSARVSDDGGYLIVSHSNAVGQADFVYTVTDASLPGRIVEARLTVKVAGIGTYAASDEAVMFGGSAPQTLDVLANDIAFPNVNKQYSITGIGAGEDAPLGQVSVVSNKLVYAPPEDFTGDDVFTYTMSDSVATDVAYVTVRVLGGTLLANPDSYTVYFEVPDGATAALGFDLPVTLNDRCDPALGATLSISGLGIDDGEVYNAPSQNGIVTVNPDNQTLHYTPVLASPTNYVETFTYIISDGGTRRSEARVTVLVQNRVDVLGALATEDFFHVHRNSASNRLEVLANDFVKPGSAAGWLVTGVTAPAKGGTSFLDGAHVYYTPPADFVGEDTFTYSVHDPYGGTGTCAVRVRVGQLCPVPDSFAVMSGTVSNRLHVVANDPRTPELSVEYTVAEVFGADQGGSVVADDDLSHVLYTPLAGHAGPYPYQETFSYVIDDDTGGLTTGRVSVTVHETGSDKSTTVITTLVTGRNDIPVITNGLLYQAITDKETAHPFLGVTVFEVDQQTLEPLDVLVWLDDAVKGVLQDLGGFVDLGGGRYSLSGVTALSATAQLRNLLFVPYENRITVPTSETARFTVSVTDNKSTPVTNDQSVVSVTAVNDPAVITGARAGQTVYAATAIRPFASLTVSEADDLMLQRLNVSVRLSQTNGVLRNLGSFVYTNGAYAATNLTAAQATAQLRQMDFLYGTNKVAQNNPQLTVFTITVDDRFAAPVTDSQTSVWAYGALEDRLEPESSVLRSGYGFSVGTISEFAVVGAPGADVNGENSGSALVHHLVPGTTNTWEVWRQLQPPEADGQDQFGYSVAISDELIAVGAVEDEVGSNAVGTVYLFQRDLGGADNWGMLCRIAPTNLPAGSRFGFAVDLDGDLLAVGAPKATLSGSTPAEGAVFLFGRNQGGTNAWGEILRWEPRAQSSVDCGWSVSVCGDQFVAGAPLNKAGTAPSAPKGAVFCFSRGTGAWGLSQTIRIASLTNAVNFGYSVSVDGGVLAVGAPTQPMAEGFSQAGEVHVFGRSGAGDAWVPLSRFDVRQDLASLFGHSLCVNKDFIFVGAPGFWQLGAKGSAYLFRRVSPDTNTWGLVERQYQPAESTTAYFGNAVSFKKEVGIVGTSDSLSGPLSTVNGNAFMYRFKFNNAPVVLAPVPDQPAEWGEPFSYTVPAGVFADPDVGDTLAVVPALPVAGSGLGVSGMTVSGTPVRLGAVPVEVLATDDSGASAMDTFNVVVLVDGVLLAATPRNQWNVEHFGKDAVKPALEGTLWGGLANADGDASNNDQEYVFNGDPTVGDTCGLIGLEETPEGNMVVSYVRRTNDPALTYTVQGTPTLTPPDWTDVQTMVLGEQATPIDEAFEFVEVTVSVTAAGPERFFRVVVTP